MIVRQATSQRPPEGMHVAFLRAPHPERAVFATDLADLLEDGPVDAQIGIQVDVEQWQHVVPQLARTTSGSVLITLLDKGSAPRSIRAMARLGAEAQVDDTILRVLAGLPADVAPERVEAGLDTRRAWQALVSRYGVLNSTQVADRVRSKARNRAGVASDLVKAGRLLAVRRVSGRLEFPDYQFSDDGTPLPVVGQVLREFRKYDWSDLSIALWADSPTGWLNNQTPAEVWGDPKHATQVLHAAHQDAIS